MLESDPVRLRDVSVLARLRQECTEEAGSEPPEGLLPVIAGTLTEASFAVW